MNINEQEISGTTHERYSQVTINYGYNQTPTIQLTKEKITLYGDETINKVIGVKQYNFDPAEVIDLMNPLTGEPIGATMTQQELMVGVYSYCIKRLLEDNVEPLEEPTEPEEEGENNEE